MSTASATATVSPDNILRALQVILIAGLTCGVLDGLSALALSGGRFTRLFQFIASGILGPEAFKGGMKVAVIGVALHFLIALTAAAVYYAASRGLPFLIDHAILFGVLYGIAIQFFMNFVVIPSSAIGKRPFSLEGFVLQLVVHMIVVGPTIALTIRHYSR